MPNTYPSQYRSMVIDQVRSGRRVADVAEVTGVPQATVFRWARQDRIDRGELAGTSSAQSAELRAAKARIAELEAELATVKRASELFAEGRVVRPKDLHGLVATLVAEGHGAKRTCRILALSPSGYFRSRHGPVTSRAVRQAWLADVITEVHVRSRRTYGTRRVRAELVDHYGQVVNKKLVRKLMRQLGLYGLPRHRQGKPNLVKRHTSEDPVNRDFRREGPDQLWMTDITEHKTREGKLYCCAVLDAWSRKVVGWSIDRRPTAAMVNAALGMALEGRKPTAGSVVHSDHGTQFTSWAFSQRVRSAGLAQSLGTVGDAFDNAVVESFWACMQVELLDTRAWKTRTELSTEIFDWIEGFYNRVRRHSSLGMMSPQDFEKLHSETTSAA